MFIGLNNAITGLIQDQLSKTINSLFSKNEQGIWYDPSDLSTLYEDAAGTTPITSPLEKPVGLMLDKSKGLVLGSELITNAADRDFSSDTGFWTKQTGVSIGGGVCSFSSVSANNGLIGNIAAINGKYVEIKVDISGYVSGDIRFVSGDYLCAALTANGSYTIRARSSSTTFAIWASATTTLNIDNISVRELLGNHAFQSTTTSRPTLSARYNLLTKTDNVSDSAWAFGNISGTATRVGNTVTFGASAFDSVRQFDKTVAANVIYTGIAKLSGSGNIRLLLTEGNGNVIATTNVSLTSTPTIYSVTGTTTVAGSSGGFGIYNNIAQTPGAVVNFEYADLRVANDGIGLPAYQRVNTATDYDYAGFPPYLKFDGTDDDMATGNIDFTATDKMFVAAGVRKLSDAPEIVIETSVNYNSNAGAIILYTDTKNNFGESGMGGLAVNSSAYAAPVTHVLSITANRSGTTGATTFGRFGVNGIDDRAGYIYADNDAGNFGNYPLYIGRRAEGTTLPFNGRLYSLVVVGKLASAAEIAATEAWVNGKTKAF